MRARPRSRPCRTGARQNLRLLSFPSCRRLFSRCLSLAAGAAVFCCGAGAGAASRRRARRFASTGAGTLTAGSAICCGSAAVAACEIAKSDPMRQRIRVRCIAPPISNVQAILNSCGQKATFGCICEVNGRRSERPLIRDAISHRRPGRCARSYPLGARCRGRDDEPVPRKNGAPAHRAWTAGIPIRVRLYGGAARRRKAAAAAARRELVPEYRKRRRGVARSRAPASRH